MTSRVRLHLPMRPVFLLAVLASCAHESPPSPSPSPVPPVAPPAPITCDSCAEWNQPHAPFQLYGNAYFVGPAGLSSVVIRTSDGLLLLDGGLPQSAAVIADNLRKLGLRPEDIRVIVNSHAHYDHAGGIAALQRLSGARVIASASGALALSHGEPTADDPQYTSGHSAALRYPPVANVSAVADQQTVTVGDVTITAHLTPGHTPGSTTWTWQSCVAGRCLNLVYADSLNPISDDGFRYTADPARVAAFQHSIDTVDHLPCDIIVSVHPGLTNLDARRDAHNFVDPNGCHAYAAAAADKLAKRLADER